MSPRSLKCMAPIYIGFKASLLGKIYAGPLLLSPPLAIAYEIAFSNHDLEDDLPDYFSASPIPDFHWSVYLPYRCNVVNHSGLKWRPAWSKCIQDILVRALPNSDGPLDIIVFHDNEPDQSDDEIDFDLNDPCFWTDARGIVRFKNGVTDCLSRGVGNGQKYNLSGANNPTHWRELDPAVGIPDQAWASLVDRLELGQTAVWWEIPDPDGGGLPQQRGDIYSGGYFTDHWYSFSEHGASLLLGPDVTDPDGS
ncbi:uncharacterized protein DFL_000896 [Arthrobotrys flagrans]|uniref:Uncharacterized protein n=1 Tax=Arthrobotrys flagrans TaxID=97331 RepID=A0A437AEZ6_ARTFL|nr:hypothetical protein DFL_000896 [Arthrobotrys flagrans]